MINKIVFIFTWLIISVSQHNIAQNSRNVIDVQIDTIKYRLNKLNQKTTFEIYCNDEVIEIINRHLERRIKYYNNRKEKFVYYLEMFEKHLKENKIPLEIKYLPIVESMLDPKAVSRAGATGLWQFMFYTGLKNGLRNNSYVDERIDPVKSTMAACRYLTKLYEIYPDWNLALASYNAGPGNVRKAIRNSGGKSDYWEIRPFLPKETANYIPKFIATMYLIEYAKEYGVDFSRKHNSFSKIGRLAVKEKISLKHVADFLKFPLDSIRFLNPSYTHEIIPFQEDKKNYLTLPKEEIRKLLSNENNFYSYSKEEFNNSAKKLPEFYTRNSRIKYKVKYGDYLGKIAKKFGVKISDIKKWNKLDGDYIKENQRLIVYPKKIPRN
tara:strand:+ start:927 stop:2069 length:1143 start_codon:yes stop_codon:yes gene_type:complete